MLPPNITSTIRDERNNVTYHVVAYRRLTRAELIAAVRDLHAQPRIRRLKKPLRDKTFTILTIHGATVSL